MEVVIESLMLLSFKDDKKQLIWNEIDIISTYNPLQKQKKMGSTGTRTRSHAYPKGVSYP